MSKLSYHHNKKTNVTYVYSIEKSYWDKEKKSPRNKQICLGKLDPKTKEIIPSKRRGKTIKRATSAPGVTAVSRVAGPFLLLEHITVQQGLDQLLKKCFPQRWRLMLSLVYFIVHRGAPYLEFRPGVPLACIPWMHQSAINESVSFCKRFPKMRGSIFFLCGYSECLRKIICVTTSPRCPLMLDTTNTPDSDTTGIMNLSNKSTWLCCLGKRVVFLPIIGACLEM